MIKNLPLLLFMLLIGCSTLTIASTTDLPQLLKSFLLLVSVVLNVWSMMGLILHIGVQKLSRN